MSIASYLKKVRVAAATPQQIAAFKATALGAVPTLTGLTWHSLPTEAPTLNFGAELVDDTTLNNVGFRTRLATLVDWSINCDSNFTSADQGLSLILAAMTGRQSVFVQYLPNAGVDIANPDLTAGVVGLALVENFNMSGATAGKEEVAITLQANGKLAMTA